MFIHVNHKQILGALVGAHSLKRFSNNKDKFDIKLIEHKDQKFFPRERGAAVSTQWRDARMALVHDHVRHDAIAVVEKVPPLQKTIQLLPAA